MENIKVKVNGKSMTIEVDLTKRLGQSASGKNQIVATTRGNMDVPNHPGVRFGLNVFAKV